MSRANKRQIPSRIYPLIGALWLSLALFATACAEADSPADGDDASVDESSEDVSESDEDPDGQEGFIGLITQLSEQEYFVDSAQGAEEAAERLGIELDVADFGQDQDRLLGLVDSFATQGADGVIIVPSNTDIGPAAIDIADAADMFVVASDSPLANDEGEPVPFVGLNNTEAGEQVGEILTRIFTELDWPIEGTYFAQVEAPFQVCLERTDAALDVFTETHDLPESNVVKVPYEGLVDQADDSMRAALTANPEAERWLIAACNDAGVVGALQALEVRDFPVEDVLGVGLGGEQSCLAFSTPYLDEGMRASTHLNPAAIGAGTVEVAYELLQGNEVEATRFVETPELNIDNFEDLLDC